jgi:hypothetical protein
MPGAGVSGSSPEAFWCTADLKAISKLNYVDYLNTLNWGPTLNKNVLQTLIKVEGSFKESQTSISFTRL